MHHNSIHTVGNVHVAGFRFAEVGCLFSHFVYVGSDWDADMAAIAADEKTREWWAVCDPW